MDSVASYSRFAIKILADSGVLRCKLKLVLSKLFSDVALAVESLCLLTPKKKSFKKIMF